MSDKDEVNKKPNVFPNQDMIDKANRTGEKIAKQFSEEQNVKENNGRISDSEMKAKEEMARNTQQQIEERDRLMREQKDKADKLEETRKEVLSQSKPDRVNTTQVNSGYNPPTEPPTPSDNSHSGGGDGSEDPNLGISQPQYDAPFDVIPLPSEGKLYKGGKKSIKVAYLTAADENILSNPNLMESGDFLEILLNRKILEPNLRYHDLHVGDRNAIMIWLRSTAYGHEYPIEVTDPNTMEPFDYTVDLSKLKTIKLSAEPDGEGYFDYTLPVSKRNIKFKLLTVGDVDEIDEHVDEVKVSKGSQYVDTVTHTLSKQIVEVDGERDKSFINHFVQIMRAGDAKGLRKYIDNIESGVDMRLNVTTPGDESIRPFLPFNFNFFWP